MSRFTAHHTPDTTTPTRVSRRRLIVLAGVAAPALLSAPALAQRVFAQSTTATPAASTTVGTGGTVTTDHGTFFDPSVVHEVSVSFDQDDYDAMIDAYSSTGDKGWLEATVTINGETFKQAGMRLKGNSSLGGLREGGMGAFGGPGGMTQGGGTQTQTTGATPAASGGQSTTAAATPSATTAQGQMPRGGDAMGGMGNVSADKPEGLPWLIKLDEYVKDQEYQGLSQFVIRSNNSKTSLNEAVALGLLMEAGLASQMAAYASFSVNGSDPALRLMIENPKTKWMKAHFSGDGLLFKSEAQGDWSYRGEDPASYTDIFDLEAGDWGSDKKNFAPLTSFLDFVNNSDDDTFTNDLSDRLDVEQFAIYLAMMDLIQNTDDIDGPGNNSYLYVAPKSEQMTVVPWDMNLAFGGFGMGGDGGFRIDGTVPTNADGTPVSLPNFTDANGTPVAFPDITDANGTPVAVPGTNTTQGGQGATMSGTPEAGAFGGMQGGFGGRSNPLAQRFNENTDFAAMVADQQASLQATLFKGGVGADILAQWVAVLQGGAAALVDADTIASEADSIASFFTGA